MEADYKQVIQNNSNDLQGFVFRYIAYEKLGDKEKAMENYDKGKKLDSCKGAFFYQFLGEIYYTFAKYNKAIDDYNQAIKLNPNDKFSIKNRDLIIQRMKK